MNVPPQNERERERQERREREIRKEEQDERERREIREQDERREKEERSQLNTLIAVPNPTTEQYSMIDSLRVKLGHKPPGLILFCSSLFIPFYISPTLFDLL